MTEDIWDEETDSSYLGLDLNEVQQPVVKMNVFEWLNGVDNCALSLIC